MVGDHAQILATLYASTTQAIRALGRFIQTEIWSIARRLGSGNTLVCVGSSQRDLIAKLSDYIYPVVNNRRAQDV